MSLGNDRFYASVGSFCRRRGFAWEFSSNLGASPFDLIYTSSVAESTVHYCIGASSSRVNADDDDDERIARCLYCEQGPYRVNLVRKKSSNTHEKLETQTLTAISKMNSRFFYFRIGSSGGWIAQIS